MKKFLLLTSILLLVILGCNQPNQKLEAIDEAVSLNPLPSWKDGPNKTDIIDFVNQVTQKGGANYVNPEERIATFDNDGTLWCEQPVVQWNSLFIK